MERFVIRDVVKCGEIHREYFILDKKKKRKKKERKRKRENNPHLFSKMECTLYERIGHKIFHHRHVYVCTFIRNKNTRVPVCISRIARSSKITIYKSILSRANLAY